MPAKGTTKREPLERVVKARLTVGKARALAQRARDCRMTQARYLRALIDTTLVSGVVPPRPSSPSVRDRDRLAREINALGLQVHKLGVNVNQLARQSNTGMVPLTRGEVVYVLNQLQLVTSAAQASLEKVLA